LRLADKYVLQFELSRPKAANAMGLTQVRDAAMAAGFASSAELHAWLDRAFGADVGWLRQAAAEARHAAALSPLDGEAYTLLADLCFLDGTDAAVAQSYVEQALRVRPYDAAVRYAVGELARRRGDIRAAIDEWSKCFGDSGPHQLRIVFWLAGGMPVEDFLSTFQPDWRTLRHVWSRYREFGQPNDIELLLAYTKEVTLRQTQDSPNAAAARIWYLQSSLFAEVGKHEAALACLEQAYARDTTNHAVRQALAAALQAAGRFAEAEAHLRWCLARRPADKGLTNALVQVTKQRLAQREPIQSALPTQVQRAASNP
jgi:tetratricopeptide (TPR) repeat protein